MILGYGKLLKTLKVQLLWISLVYMANRGYSWSMGMGGTWGAGAGIDFGWCHDIGDGSQICSCSCCSFDSYWLGSKNNNFCFSFGIEFSICLVCLFAWGFDFGSSFCLGCQESFNFGMELCFSFCFNFSFCFKSSS